MSDQLNADFCGADGQSKENPDWALIEDWAKRAPAEIADAAGAQGRVVDKEANGQSPSQSKLSAFGMLPSRFRRSADRAVERAGRDVHSGC